MPPALRTRGDSVLLDVAVSPGSRRDALGGEHDDALKISLKSPAREGRANAALVRFLAGALHLPRRDIQIVRGASSRRKTVALTGADLAEVRRRLLGDGVR
jgi:uncharacterized protein